MERNLAMLDIRVWSLLFLLVFTRLLAAGQDEDKEKLLRELMLEKEGPPETVRIKDVPLEGPVERSIYVIGPGDILTIGIWGEEERIMKIPVTPEGNIIVPSVGIIPVAGLTIQDAERKTIDTLMKFYKTRNITLTLTSIRSIKVFLSGQVDEQGSLIVTPVDRVYDAIKKAGGFREAASRRSVILERKDGSVQTLDLVEFLVHGSLDENPVLRDGDRIHVPPRQNYIRVRGEVNGLKEGGLKEQPLTGDRLPFPNEELIIEHRRGDRLSEAIEMAGGMAEAADLAHIMIRRNSDSRPDSTITVDMRDFYFNGDRAGDILVESGDIIDVPVLREFIYVTGAVQNPGSFPYESSFTAKDYVGLAGGPSSTGSNTRWRVVSVSGKKRGLSREDRLLPGETIIVPERMIRRIGNVLVPLSAVSTIIIAIAALQR
ncbi:MAG: SLBB domain-containing protein [Candidatus Glassbacteria bacterium]